MSRLTPGQKICLMLVAQHMSSKEIALRLGISPHTVDERIRKSLRILEVSNRRDAALLIMRQSQVPTRTVTLPFATRAAPLNSLSVRWRLAWIGVIALCAALGMGLLLAALESVGRMLRR